ncbi:hypothetical protein Pmani_024295 [Petrolisthes manimaculis]|uniref:Uncharacterized protein n=1 Tax=Petrolisthes manimaculis TaxID=1843537 RepID=A0AAE1PA37_9EUCA|nr:hypothetical protein Pmani_024295 [Petrolisthes manimaculis]
MPSLPCFSYRCSYGVASRSIERLIPALVAPPEMADNPLRTGASSSARRKQANPRRKQDGISLPTAVMYYSTAPGHVLIPRHPPPPRRLHGPYDELRNLTNL